MEDAAGRGESALLKVMSVSAVRTLLWTVCMIAVAFTSRVAAQTYPAPYAQTEISNGLLRAQIFLPDAQRGFYRGMRFDWAGVIGRLEYNGHNYFGPFFEKFDPSVPDVLIGDPIVAGVNSAASGPVEEFIGKDGAALGYSEAKPGETFCKIGVGSLRKPDKEPYSSYRIYTIVDGGKRSLSAGPAGIEFAQQVGCGSGYRFSYTKTIRFLKDQPVMTIEHHLVNLGKKTIATQVYDHNFLTIDHEPTGPGVVLTFAFVPHATLDMAGLAETRAKQLLFPKALEGSDTFYTELAGFGQSAADYKIRVENHKAGAGVSITGDQPLANLGVWAVRTVVAPEPFVDLSIPPGRDFRWKYTYTFYTVSK
jgi:hypothetical protein